MDGTGADRDERAAGNRDADRVAVLARAWSWLAEVESFANAGARSGELAGRAVAGVTGEDLALGGAAAPAGDPGAVAGTVATAVEDVDVALSRVLQAKGLSGEHVERIIELVDAVATVTGPSVTSPAGSAAVEPGAVAGEPVADADDAEDALGGVGSVAAARVRGRVLVEAIGVLAGAGARMEGLVVSAVGELTAAHGRVLLAEKNVALPQELSAVARQRWRAQAKAVTRLEM